MIPLFTNIDQIPQQRRGRAVAVGNFDGIHRGHAGLVSQLVGHARQLECSSLVITFDPPPILVLNPQLPVLAPLTTMERRAELLGHLGVDGLLVLPTTAQLLDLSPVQFYDQVLVQQLGMRAMVEGDNFRFGKDRAGDVRLLNEICHRDGIRFEVAATIADDQGMVSSSRIRKLLTEGNVSQANTMLTRPFSISGLVSRGAGRGAGLGFPTANLTNIKSLIPAHGVYAATVKLDGKPFAAAINIGPNPTFGEMQSKVEVHILGWQKDLYGQSLDCNLLEKVRDVVRFENVTQLLSQIQLDMAKVAKLVHGSLSLDTSKEKPT
jgi:riboflavin kinase / FMN adenylyltransferase